MAKDQVLKPRREKLYDILTTIVPNVYYQPPSNIKLVFPCIVYNLVDVDKDYANDTSYLTHYTFNTNLMIEDIDSPIVDDYLDIVPKFLNKAQVNGIYNIYGEYTL